MKNLFRYLKKYTVESILAPLFKLIEALLELTVPIVIARIIDIGIAGNDRTYVLKMCLLLVLLGAVGLLFSITAQYFSAKAAVGSVADMRSGLFRKIQSFSYSQLDKIGTPTLLTRMSSDMNQIQTGINLTLRLLLRSPFVAFGAMIMAFIVGKNATGATVAFAIVIPVLIAVIFIILLAGIPMQTKAQKGLDRTTGTLRANLEGARVIRAFRLEEHENREFSDRVTLLSRLQLAAGRVSGMLNPLTYVIINLAIVMLIRGGAIEVNSGNLTQGELVALYNYMTQILVELIKMANLIITVTKAIASAKRVSSVMDESPDMPVASVSESTETNQDVAIEFRGVSFAYPGASGTVLENIDIKIKKGETIGIIGGTGSGKSSLVRLIPRFYDVSDGAVLVNGKDVRTYEPSALRKVIGFAAQHPTVFSGTIKDNVKMGDPDATNNGILKALELAQLGGIVNEKENGLDSEVEQNGRNLSGGQRQRLSLARAFVRRPEILILDDSSSALDRVTDAALRKAIRELDYDHTSIIVSQRVESIADCDRILVLDSGKLAGLGTHGELYGSCDVYREICDSQKGGETL
jgi:ABC-type multidrug transport system fused ATPase/permease subunit